MILADMETVLQDKEMIKTYDEGRERSSHKELEKHQLRRSYAQCALSRIIDTPLVQPTTAVSLNCAAVSVHSRTGAHCLPHPSKVSSGGEDAFIIASTHQGTLTGVLDGVGGWINVGVDSGVYSRTLAHHIDLEFAEWTANGAESLRQQEGGKPLLGILERAFARMKALQIQGSCTVCLSLLLPNGSLHILNVGDSGLRVIRGDEVVFSTTEQQHSFNFPVQLGSLSDDAPSDGAYLITGVQPDDTLLLATDGVWDNLWEEEFVGVVTSSSGAFSAGLDGTARRLAEAAQRRGGDAGYVSPFAVHGQRAGLRTMGGKLDDSTAVVVRVCRAEKEE